MVNYLKQVVHKKYYLSKAVSIILKLINRKYKIEIERRKELPIFNFRELAEPIPDYPVCVIRENNHYGIGFNLQKTHPNLDFNKDVIVEHGLIFGSLVQKHHFNSFAKTILTFSNYRKNALEKRLDKSVICIGPYITWIEGIMTSDKISSTKENLGKTLLIFPSHSIPSTNIAFNEGDLISKIEEIKEKYSFDNVVVCLYWNDILLGKHEEYQTAGYLIVTAGHSFDYYFLNRLKSIIAIADFTMSNSVGTHVGYCVAEGKGHYIYPQDLANENLKKGVNRDLSQRNSKEWETFYSDKEIIARTFGEVCLSPTETQREVVEYYWGKRHEQKA